MVTKKDSKKRLSSKTLRNIARILLIVAGVIAIGGMYTLMLGKDITYVLAGIAYIFMFLSVICTFKARKTKKEEIIQEVKDMLSNPEIRKINPNVPEGTKIQPKAKSSIALMLREIVNSKEMDIMTFGLIDKDGTILLVLADNYEIIKIWKCESYEDFLENWELKK